MGSQTLGLSASPAPGSPKRLASITQGILVGGSMAGGGTVAFALIELMRSEPERAFRLLQTWGPGFLLALFVAWCVSRIINRALDIAERVGDRLAGSLENVAIEQRGLSEAGHAQAMAMQTMADKDDREKQEMQILIGVVNSKVEQTLDEQKRQNRTLERIEDALKINRPPIESELQ